MATELFEGHEGRECGEHRTTGGRAWCFVCTEWCYPEQPCCGCERPKLESEVRSLRTVLNDLLLTRQAHEEADENMSVLLCTEGPEATEDELRQASDAVGEALLAHEAAWDRARSLLAGEEKT